MSPTILVVGGLIFLFVIYVAYRIGKVLLRVFVGLAALALLSWGLWKLFHS
ncbi:MAG TPA: hypothetical protein VJ528_08500 [Geothrix sp.]|uniref:hypothetical protein n=1 Tax=Geothrix mesophila TaxID=2922723 RepID=UPI001FAD7DF4|nr:hypothetical protein [Geothrix sp. SG198]HJV38862.1 hypothetical protein [Geothrix sp.]